MRNLTTLVLLVGLAAAGCEQQEAKSPNEVSTEQAGFAARYPERIERESKDVRGYDATVREKMGTFESVPSKITEPTDWAIVEQVVEKSDAAGRDEGYAAEMRDLKAARDFFEQEKEPLVKKVGGSVQYAAKQKGCDVDAWGAVSTSLKDGIDDRIRERLRDSNDAFILIERHEEQLGKKNVPTLETVADDVAISSYVVHVEMPEAKADLEATLAGAASARSALQRSIDEEKEYQTTGKRSAGELKSSEARVKELEEKLKKLDEAEAEAKKNVEDLEQRVQQLQTDYDAALSKLKEAIAAKKKPE